MSDSLARLVNRALGKSQALGVAVPSRYAAPAQQLAAAPNLGAHAQSEEVGAPDDTAGESEAGWLHGARVMDRASRSLAGFSVASEPPEDRPEARGDRGARGDRQGAASRSEEVQSPPARVPPVPPPGSPHPTVGEPRKRMSGAPLAGQPRTGARSDAVSDAEGAPPPGAPAPALPLGEASRGVRAPVAAAPMLPLGEMSRNVGARSAGAPHAQFGQTVVAAIPAYLQALAARGGVTGPADAASDEDDAMWQRLLGPTRASAGPLAPAQSMEAAAAHDAGRARRRGDDTETAAGERAAHITIAIDRLDVHGLAAAPQPAPVARPRRGPRLTLSEYMKSQSRGGPGR